MSLGLREELLGLQSKLEMIESDLTNQMLEVEIKAESWFQMDKKAEEFVKNKKDLVITLNIGGKIFETKLETLMSVKDSLFYKIFLSEKLDLTKEIFIDRNYEYFKFVLSYLRNKKVNKNLIKFENYSYVRDEAEFYQIQELIELFRVHYIKLENKVSRYDNNYYCNIEAYEFNDDEIKIHIDMHGSNIFGEIQNPKLSTLKNTTNGNLMKFINSEFTFADIYSGYKGYLVYDFKNKIPGDYEFKFGESGYISVKIFNLE